MTDLTSAVRIVTGDSASSSELSLGLFNLNINRTVHWSRVVQKIRYLVTT